MTCFTPAIRPGAYDFICWAAVKPMDILIMAAYVAVIVCVGMATSRHRDMDSDFFLASRSMH